MIYRRFPARFLSRERRHAHLYAFGARRKLGVVEVRILETNVDVPIKALFDHHGVAFVHGRLLGCRELVPPILELNGEVVPFLSRVQVEGAIAQGEITGGMIPKVTAALEAVHAGISGVRIGNLSHLVHGGTTIGECRV